MSELFDWIIVALASVVFYDACKTHIYPVYFWVSFDDHEAITTLFGGEWPLTPEGTARAEVFCVYHDSMELLGAGRPSPLKASFGEARKTHATISLFLGCVAFLCQLICLFVCFCVSWFMSPGETAAAARGLGCAGAGLLRSRRAASASLLQVTCRGTRKTHAINSPCRPFFFWRFLLLLIFFGVRFDCRNWLRRSCAVAVEYASRWSIAEQCHLLMSADFLHFPFPEVHFLCRCAALRFLCARAVCTAVPLIFAAESPASYH